MALQNVGQDYSKAPVHLENGGLILFWNTMEVFSTEKVISFKFFLKK